MHIHETKAVILKILTATEGLLSALFWIFLIYGFDEPYTAGLTLISALIHEGGHEACLILLRGRGGRLRPRLSGFGIKGPLQHSYKGEILMYLSGPLANLLLAVVFLIFIPFFDNYARAGAVISLATGLSNLLPVPGYDGYGIIRTVLDSLSAPRIFYRLLSALSFAICATASLISLYLLARVGDGYWIYAVFMSGTLSLISKSLKKTNFEN